MLPIDKRHLICSLPDNFSPPTAMSLADEEFIQIASEPETHRRRQKTLVALIQGLKDSFLHLQS